MRLICPSCGAQYEVDEGVIPESGRDVQCSNCGHAWFQKSAATLRDEAMRIALAEPAAPPAPAPEPVESDIVEGEIGVSESPYGREADSTPEPDEPVLETVRPAAEEDPRLDNEAAEVSPETAAPEPEPAPPPMPERPRRTLDDAVRNVLREEAERESRARAFEGGPASTPFEPPRPPPPVASVVAPLPSADREEPTDDDAEGDPAAITRAPRRELLPDIEEINSTLRPTSERGGEAASRDAPETIARKRSGFRFGFSTALLVAAALLAVYVLAPALVRAMPALEPALTGYVTGIDSARLWLDDRIRLLTDRMQDPS